eukprot:UN07455
MVHRLKTSDLGHDKEPDKFVRGTFVRFKKPGPYQGDLALVMQTGRAGDVAFIKYVPRID